MVAVTMKPVLHRVTKERGWFLSREVSGGVVDVHLTWCPSHFTGFVRTVVSFDCMQGPSRATRQAARPLASRTPLLRFGLVTRLVTVRQPFSSLLPEI